MVISRCFSALRPFAKAKYCFIALPLLAFACLTRRASAPPPSSPCTPPTSVLLNVVYQEQILGNWCWAAAGGMIMTFQGVDVPQCRQVSAQISPPRDCCVTPTPGVCNITGWPDFNTYGFNFTKTTNKPLPWGEVRNQLGCLSLPFTFAWSFSGGGGHIYAAVGYQTKEDGSYLEIDDPQPYNPLSLISGEHAIITSAVYSNGFPGTGTRHWNDYYNIKKRR